MPPKCPSCGRFLSNDFIQGLLVEPAPCPRCGTELTADLFHGSEALVHAPEPLAESVRPPDLPPETVRPAEERDPLEDWDRAPAPASLADRSAAPVLPPTLPTTPRQVLTIIVAGVVGGLLGGLLTGGRRSGAVVGTLVGAAAGAMRPGQRDLPA